MSDAQLATVGMSDIYTPSQYSSIKQTDKETRKLVVNAMNNAGSLSAMEGKVLDVIGVFAKPGVRRSREKNGVDQPCTNITIVCADGNAYFSQSEGVRNAVDNFMAADLFADGEAIPMKLISSKLPNDKIHKTLVLV